MSYRPPFARMRQIRQFAEARVTDTAPSVSEPASVEEALAQVAEPVSEEPERPVAVDEPAPTPPQVVPSLEMTRKQLNKLAEEAGVQYPERLPSKQAVLDAIAARQG